MTLLSSSLATIRIRWLSMETANAAAVFWVRKYKCGGTRIRWVMIFGCFASIVIAKKNVDEKGVCWNYFTQILWLFRESSKRIIILKNYKIYFYSIRFELVDKRRFNETFRADHNFLKVSRPLQPINIQELTNIYCRNCGKLQNRRYPIYDLILRYRRQREFCVQGGK